MLWAYFEFSQFLITYSGNLPEEIGFYIHRMSPGLAEANGLPDGGSLGLGARVMLWAEQLAGHSDRIDGLTVAYLTRAHQTAAAEIAGWMIEAGMEVEIDALGNVVGRYVSSNPRARTLMTGSHFDTVRNGGKYDGRLGILLPIAVIQRLNDNGIRLPYHVEVVAFAEEEGLRFRSSFLASSALVGSFDFAVLRSGLLNHRLK